MINTKDLAGLYIGMSIFKNRKLSSIYESMGVSNDVISSVDYVTEKYLSDFKERKFPYGIHSYYVTFVGRECDFFKDINIFTVYRNSPYDSYGPGAEFLDESWFDNEGYHIRMKLFLYGDPFAFKDSLFEEIGHELAHAYDDYNELKRSAMKYSRFRDDSFRDLEKMNNYMLNSSDKDSMEFGLVLHMIDEVETVGYQHEIAAEIMHTDFSEYGIENAKEFNKFLMKTYVMSRIKESEDYIKKIENSDDKSFKSKILGIFNDVYGKKYDYDKMISFIKYRFMKVRKKILQAAGGAFVGKMEMRLNHRIF